MRSRSHVHALDQARHAFAEAKAEGVETTKEASAMRLAGDQVEELEVALEHAEDTLKAAQAEAKRLKQEVVNAQRYETRMHFKIVVGPKVEQFILDAERLVEEDLIPSSAAALAATPPGY